ncbi:hypothetical protein D6779_08295, partial [Candidatus Parcubacteria bacterium]
LLCALLFGLCACTPEAIPPPEPVPPLAAGAPQGNPEDVQEECTCQMRVESVSGNNGAAWELTDWPNLWQISGSNNDGYWSFYFNEPIANGLSLPTDWFEIPPITESEVGCDEFRITSFSEGLILHVKVRCFLGNNTNPASEISDDFTFAEGIPVPGSEGFTRRFFRQYICQERTADNPDPCKEPISTIGPG